MHGMQAKIDLKRPPKGISPLGLCNGTLIDTKQRKRPTTPTKGVPPEPKPAKYTPVLCESPCCYLSPPAAV